MNDNMSIQILMKTRGKKCRVAYQIDRITISAYKVYIEVYEGDILLNKGEITQAELFKVLEGIE